MQTLHQELEPTTKASAHVLHPTLRGLMADQATAYADEVRNLRQRIAELESELAATKVAASAIIDRSTVPLAPIDFAPGGSRDVVVASEFVEPTTPAVVAVVATVPAATANREPGPTADATSEPARPALGPGFAQAWSAADSPASFEERVAERAFFRASTVDEESRTWLLTQ